VPPKRLLLAAAALLAACTGDDDDGDATATTEPPAGCPVAAAVVAEAVAHPVTVDDAVTGDGTCRFVGDGARIEIVARSLADEGFGVTRAEVERRSGPTVDLADGAVDGAERGWIATVGRAVQLAAADGETLVVVAVTDPVLDAEAAQAVAARLAGEVLSS
jgi:hypothetical protein